jgi:hypothetical protein
VRRYKTTLGDEPTQKGVNYWFYDAEAALFRIIFFSNNGNFSEEGRYAGGVPTGRSRSKARRASVTASMTPARSGSIKTGRS